MRIRLPLELEEVPRLRVILGFDLLSRYGSIVLVPRSLRLRLILDFSNLMVQGRWAYLFFFPSRLSPSELGSSEETQVDCATSVLHSHAVVFFSNDVQSFSEVRFWLFFHFLFLCPAKAKVLY